MGELWNLSCTPFFSKVLESFILQRLRGENILSKEQFGGVKGTSATHFTISVLQEVMEAMETPNTVLNLMSVDYEKVFYRMDHSKCLQALWGLGANSESVGLVHAFLNVQKMSVKINDMKSKPRTAPGGSPQGSILANFLFCAMTNGLGRIKNVTNLQIPFSPDSLTIARPDITTSTPTTRVQFSNFNPPGNLEDNLSGSFFRAMKHIRKLLKRPLKTLTGSLRNKPLTWDYSHIGPICMYQIAAKLHLRRKPESQDWSVNMLILLLSL